MKVAYFLLFLTIASYATSAQIQVGGWSFTVQTSSGTQTYGYRDAIANVGAILNLDNPTFDIINHSRKLYFQRNPNGKYGGACRNRINGAGFLKKGQDLTPC